MTSRDEDESSAIVQLVLRLRRAGIKDNRILEAIEKINRSKYVEPQLASLCETDISLPLPFGQTSLRPSDAGRILQLADLNKKSMSVLIVGGGTGYLAALASRLGSSVWIAERVKGLVDIMKSNLAGALPDYKILHCDCQSNWPDDTKFERIIVSFATDSLSRRLLRNLRRDGRMVIPLRRGRSLIANAYDGNGREVANSQLIGPITTVQSGISSLE